MSTLSFLADEHVKRAYVSALRSNGFRVRTVGEDYESGRPDESLLSIARREGVVVITNDDDFVRLAGDADHAGIIMYRQQDHTAREFVRAIKRIDRHLDPVAFENHVEWLEGWLCGDGARRGVRRDGRSRRRRRPPDNRPARRQPGGLTW